MEKAAPVADFLKPICKNSKRQSRRRGRALPVRALVLRLELLGRFLEIRVLDDAVGRADKLNKAEDFILALVEVPASDEFQEGDAWTVRQPVGGYGDPRGCIVRYLRQPFQKEPDFGVTSVNYDLRELLARAEPPK